MKTTMMLALQRVLLIALMVVLAHTRVGGQNLEQGFRSPPDTAKPWVFWFWMNGNISREEITKDLESMKQVGIGGVLWMEVSGPSWAPQGPLEAGSKEWHEAMQWAITEADRLGMAFSLSVRPPCRVFRGMWMRSPGPTTRSSSPRCA